MGPECVVRLQDRLLVGRARGDPPLTLTNVYARFCNPKLPGLSAGSCDRAVTSISIFMRGSASAQTCIVAAGSATAKARRSAGQQASKSSASGSR